MELPFYSRLDQKSKYILKCCFFVFAVNGLYSMILGPLLPLLSDEYRLSGTVSGLLLSAHQTGTVIASFLAGLLPVYLGRKRSVIVLCVFVIAGFGIMMSTGSPLLLLAAFLFTGISRGSISNFSNTTVSQVSKSSPAALNLLHGVFAVGALLAPFLVIFSTRAGGDAGWRIAGGVIIFLCILSMIFFSAMELDETPAAEKKKAASYDFLKLRLFWISAGILFFYLCAEAAVNGWLVKYFLDEGLMSREYAQVLASVLWMVILLGRLSCAYIGDRISKNSILVFTGVGTAVFYVALMGARSVWMITPAVAGLGFFMAGIYPTTVAAAGRTIRQYPMAMGVLLTIATAGGIVMPMITGALADVFGIAVGMAAVVGAIALMLLCIVLYLFDSKKN